MHFLFVISVVFKGIDGVVETIVGGALFFISPASLRELVGWLTRGELQEDPDDFVATHLVAYFNHLSFDTKYFAAIFLLIHGVVKLGLVTGLLLGKLWAFPTALATLGLFFCYQIYRIINTHSIGLAFLSVTDLLVLILIWNEYRRLKTERHHSGNSKTSLEINHFKT